jgi:methylmalonyl-CoA/ethylmalonyl-CoA epimerase
MKATIDHIGIAVESLERALAFYRDVLGLDVSDVSEVPGDGVRAAFVPVGGPALELLEATDEQSPIARFVARRGPGLHHVTLTVDDLAGVLDRLKQQGVRLIDEQPRAGAHGSRVAFIHPSAAGGVLLELKDRAPSGATG